MPSSPSASPEGPILAVEVAVALPLAGTFHYSVPPHLVDRLHPGSVVLVPFGPRRITAYVLESPRVIPDPPRNLKSVEKLLLENPAFPASLLSFYRFTAEYYHHPLGEVIRASLPAAVREETRSQVCLSPEAGPPPGEDVELGRLLASLAESGPLSLASLGKRGFATPLVQRALRGGWVTEEQRVHREAARARLHPFYSLTESPRLTRERYPRPGPVRDRLIDYLGRFAPVGREVLLREFPNASQHLRDLLQRGLVVLEEREGAHAENSGVNRGEEEEIPQELTSDQRRALQAVESALQERTGRTLLLHGVTGSGKTEVYLRAAEAVRSEGGGVIFLVPEIALTPQLVRRVRARLPGPLAVLHSGLTPRQRFDQWQRIQEGGAQVVVGARSAVFAPVKNLRLLVVDEEHDSSYKQDEGLRYSARDLAVVRAAREGAVCLLGSATPSLESYRNAVSGRFEKLVLPERPRQRPMPRVEVVDLRGSARPGSAKDAPGKWLSEPLREALTETLAQGEQAILLLNRRGFATAVTCTTCGGSFRCTECDVALTYHGRRHHLLCHWCGLRRPLPEVCPSCQAATLMLLGRGTERIEEELLHLLPEARVDRMDQDTTRTKDAHRDILERFGRREVDILVGTQMISKGHDFPAVTLVGVLHGDAALYLPDFRAAERTFQLLTQVAGRAGRADKPGRVIVQAWNPFHYAIRHALDHDYLGFYRREARLRQAMVYPPFGRMAVLRVEGPDERETEAAARRILALVLQGVEGAQGRPGAAGLRLLGPTPAPLYRCEGRYRWQLSVRAPDHRAVQAVLREAEKAVREEARGNLRVSLDVDPQTLV